MKNTEDGYWSLVDPLWDEFNAAWDSDPKEFVRRFSSVRSDARYLYASHWCVSEVDNGGFYQFFSNTTGILAPEALEGFRRIGLVQLAEALTKAIDFFGEPYPRERNERLGLLPTWPSGERDKWDPFRKLDNDFYEQSTQWEQAADAFARDIWLSSNG